MIPMLRRPAGGWSVGFGLLWRSVVLTILALSVANHTPAASKPKLLAAVPLDMPPYVMGHATTGLQVDLVRQALPGYRVRFRQLPYGMLATAVPQNRADAAVGVQETDDGTFYSDDFITFTNDEITTKADELTIDRIADLAHHRVLAWQDAYVELGDEFERLFAPRSPQRNSYTEFADQAEQVRAFWQGQGNVIVIDRNIFSHFSEAMRHSIKEVRVHALFPAVTTFKASFKEPAVRDAFNQGLTRLCDDGTYAQLLARYEVELPRTVCE